MLTNLSAKLKQKIKQALSGEGTACYRVQCIFSNPTTGFRYVPLWVSSVLLVQDFLDKYMDTMEISFSVNMDSLRDLLKNAQDLKCTVILTPVTPASVKVSYDQDEIVWDMMVYMDDQPDLDKIFTTSRFENPEKERKELVSQQEAYGDFTVTLISETMHTVRGIGINAILKDTTMNDVLHWICQQFKFENVEVIEPDNTVTYEAVIIPPLQYIGEVFEFLQERYGVYSKGLGYYFTNDTMYIYPLYDTELDTSPVDGTLHLVNIPENEYLGLNLYHVVVDDDIIVGSNSRARAKPLNSSGSENVATSYISVNSGQMLDQDVTIDGSGKVQKAKNITVLKLQNTAGNMTSSMQNVKFSGQRTNVYAATSQLAAFNGTELTTAWIHAVPGLLKPGQHVIYHFDGQKGIYKTQEGKLARVIYRTTTSPSGVSTMPNLTFTAALQIFLTPDEESDPEIQYN